MCSAHSLNSNQPKASLFHLYASPLALPSNCIILKQIPTSYNCTHKYFNMNLLKSPQNCHNIIAMPKRNQKSHIIVFPVSISISNCNDFSI